MKKTTKKNLSKSQSDIQSNNEWIIVHEQFDGDEIYIKKNQIEAVEKLRSSYDGKPAGSTAWHKEICKIHTYGGKTFGIKEKHSDIIKELI